MEANKWGTIYAYKQSEATIIEDRKNDMLAIITEEAEGSSHAEKERKARVSEKWRAYRESLSHSKNEALKARVEYDKAKRLWETARSLLSSMNTQRRSYT